jgi:hypothetical protein
LYNETTVVAASDCGFVSKGKIALISNKILITSLLLQSAACALLIGNIGSYAYAQPDSGTATLVPMAYKTVFGKDNAQPVSSSIDVLDESDKMNVWAKYLQFQARSASCAYTGTRDFYMTGDLTSERVTDITVKVNFRGPLPTLQVWTWYIHNWTTNAWDQVGTNPSSPGWDAWTTLKFTATGSPLAYIRSGDGLIQLGTTSNNAADDADIDYEAVVVDYFTKGK